MKKILLSILLIGAAAFSLQSCDDDDNDIFDKSAAVRIDYAVAETKALLVSSPNGWMMHYYTGREYTGGGFTMFVKFDGSKAHASSDIAADVNMVSTSSYDVIKDQGPVLTFNTYNEILHFLAQPYQGDVDGEEGDYEFIVQKITDDAIYLKGKRFGNKFVMTRVPESLNWADYLTELKKVDEATAFLYLLQRGDQVVDSLIIDRDAHNIQFASQTETTPYYYVPGGIEIHTPITAVDGTSVSSLHLVDASSSKYTDQTGTVEFVKCEDDGFNMDITQFAGEWTMTYTNMNHRTVSDKILFETYDEYIGKQSHTVLRGTFSYTGPARAGIGPDADLEDAAGDYNLFLMYDIRTGKLQFSHYSTSADPTEKFDYLIFVGASLDSEGYFNFGQVQFAYQKSTGNLVIDGSNNGFAYLNTYIDEEGDDGLALRFYGLNINGLKRVNK
jgi:hypothetical protein